ncbi:ATP-binding protein [Patescibacteria group bacterium]|nr:ATP-binding protein [Patescibacteria group bacterium]MBU4512214.1 ATP-binding protein [Patescibacteria group bacterium]MCG2692632.1 ATP-binding protein [Candidatus Parcubacteria bacterium]
MFTKKPKKSFITVTVDKSHLLTLGEKMYVESIELLRELVNNAYDADATEVYVTITPSRIEVEDNGSGMNEKGLAQYFNIGSPEKRVHSVSPKFGRKRIGEFGIGKFAALAVADKFEIQARKGKHTYQVIFNKKDWESGDKWDLPIEKVPASPLDIGGTRVILTELKKEFSVADARQHLIDAVPLRAKKFIVFVNNHRLTLKSVAGRHLPIKHKTIYGLIEGEIIITLNAQQVDKPGIECRVKGALIKRELFGLEKSHEIGLRRITGSIEADFLPITSGRSEFIIDSPEYKIFYNLMKAELEKVLKILKKERDTRDLKKMNKALHEALSHIRQALKMNPDLVPSGKALRQRKKLGLNLQGVKITKNREAEKAEEMKAQGSGDKDKVNKSKEEENKPEIEKTLMRRIRLKDFGVSCAFAHLGEQGPEAVSEGNLIYINQDHLLYLKYSKNKNEQQIHLLRLITQEISMMKRLHVSARAAYDFQSKLLKDAID